MDLPKVHPRTIPLQKAGATFGLWFIDFSKEHKLTTSEEIFLLTDELRSIISSCIRTERTPKKGRK